MGIGGSCRRWAGSFANRRKTLANNWAAAFGMEKAAAEDILAAHTLGRLARPEELPLGAWLSLRDDPTLRSAMRVRAS